MQTRARGGAGTNQEAVRRHNLGTLLGQVHLRGRVSRADLTTHMGLNRSTIAGLVTELESIGLAETSTGEYLSRRAVLAALRALQP